ncbi:hypothetical protein CSKR_104794 [Clonorchis sinensis]|uniref:Uncharacterized protein n=2 Tax=Clonorchis sinensis TaxID=79923 RepID=A0A8T1M1E4_CLOSI|nr:hypothetical protein CSKR_104794 [Clonorchis sinensis]GAA47833.1 hypothetical protein CLF_100855 [Clonorchis sinensis]
MCTNALVTLALHMSFSSTETDKRDSVANFSKEVSSPQLSGSVDSFLSSLFEYFQPPTRSVHVLWMATTATIILSFK